MGWRRVVVVVVVVEVVVVVVVVVCSVITAIVLLSFLQWREGEGGALSVWGLQTDPRRRSPVTWPREQEDDVSRRASVCWRCLSAARRRPSSVISVCLTSLTWKCWPNKNASCQLCLVFCEPASYDFITFLQWHRAQTDILKHNYICHKIWSFLYKDTKKCHGNCAELLLQNQFVNGFCFIHCLIVSVCII